jgi:hypothetical protein
MICVFISSIGVYDDYLFKIITESIVFCVAFVYLIIKTDTSIHNFKNNLKSDVIENFKRDEEKRWKITKFLLWLIGDETDFKCCCYYSDNDFEGLPIEIVNQIKRKNKKISKVSPNLEP